MHHQIKGAAGELDIRIRERSDLHGSHLSLNFFPLLIDKIIMKESVKKSLRNHLHP